MEDLYKLDHTISISNNDDINVTVENFTPNLTSSCSEFHNYPVGNFIQFDHETGLDDHDHNWIQVASGGSHHHHNMSDLIKTQISNHPLYADLVSAYIACQKVGAPPEVASLLEEISRENCVVNSCSENFGVNPELDAFMDSYCKILQGFKDELSKPLHEARTFLSSIELELRTLCKENFTFDNASAEAAGDHAASGSSDQELSCEEVEATASEESCGGGGLVEQDGDLKGMLLRKYSGYLSNLRKEFLKISKKGKLPTEARMVLLDWWNTHNRWPYPTEEEKVKLSEMTGLEPKQINNWFINQRKRHWTPPEEMKLAFFGGGSSSGTNRTRGATNSNNTTGITGSTNE